MYKACIFDLDGTLTDTLESLTFSVNETLKEVALPAITEEQCRTFVGNGAKVLIEQSLKAAGDTKLLLFEKAFEAYGRIFDRNCTYHVKPYPGIREMLLKLKDQNMKLGVLSNKPDRQAVHVVEEIFGKETFDLVWGQREGVPRKPDPSALFAMAESLGVSSGRGIVYRRFRGRRCDGKCGGYGYGSCRMGISITRRTGKGRCIQNCGSGR